jgi:hypothetical protein
MSKTKDNGPKVCEQVWIGDKMYTFYELPVGRNRSGEKNTVYTFQKRTDGNVYQLAAQSVAFLSGYLLGCHHNITEALVPLTFDQFSELDGEISQSLASPPGPSLAHSHYVGHQ